MNDEWDFVALRAGVGLRLLCSRLKTDNGKRITMNSGLCGQWTMWTMWTMWTWWTLWTSLLGRHLKFCLFPGKMRPLQSKIKKGIASMSEKELIIPTHGGYKKLKSFQIAQVIYDVTVRFCNRYIKKGSRTHDQMVQAARSGVQNIAEGSMASGTSKATEIKLTNVARASLEELRLDYIDFLRQRGLPVWDREDPRRQSIIDRKCSTADEVAQWVKELHRSDPGGASIPEIASNAMTVLITVACCLLERQLEAQTKEFEEKGGFTERLYKVRSNAAGTKYK